MNLITTLKSNFLGILCVVLLTISTMLYLDGRSDKENLKVAEASLIKHVEMNKRLSDQNLDLAQQLSKSPEIQIPIVREIAKEICIGEITKETINNLPTKQREVTNGEVTAGIDDLLPHDLLKLLK